MTTRAGPPSSISGNRRFTSIEVAEVVRPELQLEPVRRGRLRAPHDPCVGDQHVDAVMAIRDERVGDSSDRVQRRQIGLVQLDPRGADVVQRDPGPVEVADDAGDGRSVRGQRSGGLEAQPRRGAGDDLGSGQVEFRQDVGRGGVELEGGHGRMLHPR